MPPKATKPAIGDSITLNSRDAAAIRAGFLSGGDWQYNSNEIGKLLGLGCTRNGGRVFQNAINKIGLEYSNGSFRDMTEDDVTAPTSPAAPKTINNTGGTTGKKRKANSGGQCGVKAEKKVKLEKDESDAGTADNERSKDTGEKADTAAAASTIKAESVVEQRL